jgi:hypothetical protein
MKEKRKAQVFSSSATSIPTNQTKQELADAIHNQKHNLHAA